MFAREVDRPLACALVAGEVRVLPDTPAGVTAPQIGVAGGVAQGGPAGVVGADAGEDTLQLLQAVASIVLDVRRVDGRGIGRRGRVSGPSLPAGIIDEQPAGACLTTGSVPERLNIQVRNDEAVVSAGPGTIRVPVGLVELQEQLGDRAVAKLFDGHLLQGIKSGPPAINAAQGAEGQREDGSFAAHFH